MKTKSPLLSMLAILLIAGNLQAQDANTSLSNLTSPTAVNQKLLPERTNAIDLGSTTKLWRNGYFSGDELIHGLTLGLGAGAIFSNTALGNGALHSNTTGYQNTASGYQALYFNITGYQNTVNGYQTLFSNITGYKNIANGYQALLHNISGADNIANGYQALYSNTTGGTNIANGYQALFSNTEGNLNIANGVQALYSNTTGFENIASGNYSLYSNTNGFNNTATGYQALGGNTTGYYNTANGYWSLIDNTTGYNNTATGLAALFNNATGSYNTANGQEALYSNTTGNSNTEEGSYANVNSGDYSNSSAFGNSALITASNQVRLGNSDVTSIGGYVNWSNISDGRVKKNIKQNVPGLAFINQLQPVTYNLDLDAADNIVQRPVIKDQNGIAFKPSREELDVRKAKEQIVYTGFVAQDAEAAAKKIGYDFSGVDAPKNDKDLYALRYADSVVPLVKAVQELSQQNTDLKKEVDDLKAAIENPKSAMNGSDAKLQSSNFEFQTASLDQNSPNPFSQNTVIGYFIPQTANNAVIKIYSLEGEEIKSFNVNDNGIGQISIAGSTMQAGVYVYILIVDGVTIDTKQMILTK